MKIERKLVTLRTITEVRRLKCARYKGHDVVTIDGGWSIVVFHSAFICGQLVLFFEIDSFIPAINGRFSWEYSRDMTEFQGTKGFHVRSQMFGKQLSQGFVLHIDAWPEVKNVMDELDKEHGSEKASEIANDMSFEGILGVRKWEIPFEVRGKILGQVPQFFPRPACERVQNDSSIFTAKHLDTVFQVTEKLDGVSMTVYCVIKDSKWYQSLPDLPIGSTQETPTSRLGVASAGQDLDERGDDAYWQAAKRIGLPEKLREIGISNVAVQGELIGPTVKDNSLRFAKNAAHEFIVFQIFDIDRQAYVKPGEVVTICEKMGLPHVPVIGYVRLRDFARSLDDGSRPRAWAFTAKHEKDSCSRACETSFRSRSSQTNGSSSRGNNHFPLVQGKGTALSPNQQGMGQQLSTIVVSADTCSPSGTNCFSS